MKKMIKVVAFGALSLCAIYLIALQVQSGESKRLGKFSFSQAAHAHEEGCDALFVIRAKGMSFDGSRMVLHGTDPNITYFCDRPVRTAGHLTIDALRAIVTKGENNFLENPPNAALSIFGDGGEISDIIVLLPSAPKVTGDELDFEVRVIEGELPATGGALVLFVDPIGVPVSPTSAAGVHRRHKRRAVRRANQ